MGSEQTERRELWRQRVVDQEKSGLTVRAYCKQKDLPEPAFYGWRRRLRPEVPVGFALVETKPVIREAAMLELVLAHGHRLRIPGDEAMLRLVLGVLREQP
jgi:hypothetical protein